MITSPPLHPTPAWLCALFNPGAPLPTPQPSNIPTTPPGTPEPEPAPPAIDDPHRPGEPTPINEPPATKEPVLSHPLVLPPHGVLQ